jgi:Zn-dependent protease
MEEKLPEKVRSTTSQIGGVSIAWVTLFGALLGVTGLVPIFPYVGGGGYVPLTTPLAAIAPLLLGPVGGVVSALVGGLIGIHRPCRLPAAGGGHLSECRAPCPVRGAHDPR